MTKLFDRSVTTDTARDVVELDDPDLFVLMHSYNVLAHIASPRHFQAAVGAHEARILLALVAPVLMQAIPVLIGALTT